MDQQTISQPNTPTTPIVPPAQVVTPTPQTPPTPSKGPNIVLIIGIILALVLTIVGGLGALSYMNTQKAAPPVVKTETQATPEPSPTSETTGMEAQLNATESAIEDDFKGVDQEINGL